MQRLLGEKLFYEYKKYPLVTEIRLRKNKPVVVKKHSERHTTSIIADAAIIKNIVSVATKYSLYAYDEEIRKGFIFYENGVRIGLGGTGTVINERLNGYREITSLCIRIPHQILDCSRPFCDLYENFSNTLIISPPGGGKTTLIRDLTRNLSENYDTLIIDERYELGGQGLCLDVGKNADLLQGIPKHICFENALRSLSPQIIVCDELFGRGDEEAVKRLIFSGVRVLASMHADSYESARNIHPELLPHFDNIIILSSIPTSGSIKSVIKKEH